MDAVYLYKSIGVGTELKLSILLLRKFYKNLGTIWVIGDKPPASVADYVTHIYHKSTMNKFADQFAKVRIIAKHPEVSDDFILMNDDFFLLDDYEPVAYRSIDYPTLRDRSKKVKSYGMYRDSLLMTSSYLLGHSLLDLNYELHVPMPINKMKFNQMGVNFPADCTAQLRSLYGNWYPVDFLGIEKISDCKNIKFEEATKFLSTSEATIGGYKRKLEGAL